MRPDGGFPYRWSDDNSRILIRCRRGPRASEAPRTSPALDQPPHGTVVARRALVLLFLLIHDHVVQECCDLPGNGQGGGGQVKRLVCREGTIRHLDRDVRRARRLHVPEVVGQTGFELLQKSPQIARPGGDPLDKCVEIDGVLHVEVILLEDRRVTPAPRILAPESTVVPRDPAPLFVVVDEELFGGEGGEILVHVQT